jgi:RsiW-degrading membrane proteinase PrsW (M82 family)
MLLEALSSAILGLTLAWAAARRLPHRLPARALVLPTGVTGALFGAFLMNTALDAGNLLTILLGAVIVSVASLSLLLRPAGRLRRRSATA